MRHLHPVWTRPSGVVAGVAIAALAASAMVGSAAADPEKASPHAAHWMPFSAFAPCKGAASIATRVSHNPDIHQGDRLRVRVTGAQPHSRWKLEVAVYSGDTGSIGTFPTQHADGQGKWVFRDYAASAHTRVLVTSTSALGQHCRLSVTGQIIKY